MKEKARTTLLGGERSSINIFFHTAQQPALAGCVHNGYSQSEIDRKF